jgi:hypothetical protein
MKKLLVGLVAGVVLATAVPAIASWFVESRGEASVMLDRLEPLKIGPATVKDGDEALPSKQVSLVSDVDNPNSVALTILSSRLTELKAEDPACDVSDIEYRDNNDVAVPPGKSEHVAVGRLVLPNRMAQACMGANLKGTITVKAAYGA